MVEWAEHTLRHKVNEVKKDTAVESIIVGELEASTANAQEYIDFLLRLLEDDERLKSLEIKNIHGLDEPLNKDLLERVAKKTDSFKIGSMPNLKDEVRESMTECIASFLESSETLNSVDISDYIQNNQEA